MFDSKEIHKNAISKGFYNNDFEIIRRIEMNEYLEPKHQKYITTLQYITKIALIITELSEAIEGIRNGKELKPQNFYDYDESQFMELIKAYGDTPEIELADAIIRAIDLLEAKGLDVEKLVRMKHYYNKTRPYLHGKEL